MAEFELKDVEVKKEMPDYSGGPAKVLKLTLEDQGGNTHQAEMFTMASTASPTIGQKLEGEISESDYGPKFSRGGAKKGGGFKKSPAETKAIQRQHSQEMMLREEQNRLAFGQPLFTNDERQQVIDYYEDDIKGKAGTRGLVRFSDVPVDDTDLPFK